MNAPEWIGSNKSLLRFTRVYAVIAVLELISNVVFERIPLLHYCVKPLIMISLGVYFVSQSQRKLNLFSVAILFAIGFSWLGDVFLMGASSLSFLVGLGSFLIAQVAYTLAFNQPTDAHAPKRLTRRKPWVLIPFVLYAAGLLWAVKDGADMLFGPIVVYALVIMLMALSALNRWKRVLSQSFAMVFLGAMLFMLSDSLIALSRFGGELTIPYASLWIMSTYMAAQYLIVIGMLKHFNYEASFDPSEEKMGF
ncbi:lysoplasmalogenase [Pontibacter sp. G13]|uniref:lysoplasmalogenase n=1 Tax=Pontibacter sp. G13 TaxID=3074898 RepID=UPI00288B55DD|nr:lysoplasmalogenase [Pontibacter sp. G13]WNJ16346.1 lysoplasmalogenase [Pontibacter sp. G13]